MQSVYTIIITNLANTSNAKWSLHYFIGTLRLLLFGLLRKTRRIARNSQILHHKLRIFFFCNQRRNRIWYNTNCIRLSDFVQSPKDIFGKRWQFSACWLFCLPAVCRRSTHIGSAAKRYNQPSDVGLHVHDVSIDLVPEEWRRPEHRAARHSIV